MPQPFDVSRAMTMNVAGSNGIDQSLDYIAGREGQSRRVKRADSLVAQARRQAER